MKKLLLIFVVLIFFSVLSSAFAHTGGGPPFVKVNGKFANTNYYSPNLEDIGPEQYFVNKPVSFLVDTTALNVPKDIAQNSKFRWSFEKQNAYLEGVNVDHAFTSPKSYFIHLEVLAPLESSYISLNTIQINVLSDSSYKIPQTKILVGADTQSANEKLLFKSEVKHDPSSQIVSYFWDFGDGATTTNKEPVHAYSGKDYSYLVSLRVEDSKGFANYAGFVASAVNNKLDLTDPFGTSPQKIPILKKREFEKSNSSALNTRQNVWPIVIYFVLLGIGVGVLIKVMRYISKQGSPKNIT